MCMYIYTDRDADTFTIGMLLCLVAYITYSADETKISKVWNISTFKRIVYRQFYYSIVIENQECVRISKRVIILRLKKKNKFEERMKYDRKV